MQKYRRIIINGLIISTFLILLNSCEGMKCAEGHVFDSETNEPLDSVLCRAVTGSEELYSDSTGYYSLCNNFAGCVPDCPDIEVEYSKQGYKTKKITNPNKADIYLEKE